jgi:PAS domain S-box-containing protein
LSNASVDAAGTTLDPAAATALAQLVISVADAVYAVDAQGQVRYANPAALRVLGYDDPAELLGRPSHRTIHHSHPDGTPFPESECPLLKPRVTGEIVRVEEDWFVRRDQSYIPVAYSSAPVEGPDGRGAVVVFHDTTQARAVREAERQAAVERARAQELHDSRARLVAAAHEERRRLGRDLHDGAQQHLVNVLVALQLLSSADHAHRADLVEQALAETRTAIDDLRTLAAGLLPSVLLHRGLRGAIESLTASAPLPVELDVTDRRFDPQVEAAAYFFVAEALTNVAKHAQATVASVSAAADEDTLTVEVADDGVGGASPSAGHGLLGLADRLAALDGSLQIEAAVPHGTLLRARLPA